MLRLLGTFTHTLEDTVLFVRPGKNYSSGQNKVPTAEWKSRSIVAQWKIISAYVPL